MGGCCFEALEPRLLLSAAPVFALLDDARNDASEHVPAVEAPVQPAADPAAEAVARAGERAGERDGGGPPDLLALPEWVVIDRDAASPSVGDADISLSDSDVLGNDLLAQRYGNDRPIAEDRNNNGNGNGNGGGPGKDAFAYGDSFDDATDLGTLGSFSDSGLEISHPQNRDDFFQFTPEVGGHVTASIVYTHADGNIDLNVYNADQNRIGWSATDLDDETVETAVISGETYYVHVEGGHQVNNVYDIEIEVAPTDIPPDDYEPNGSFEEAYDLGTLGSWWDTGLTLHEPGNDDYFRFTAVADGEVEVSLYSGYRIGATDIHIYDAERNELDWAWGLSTDLLATADVAEGEEYYVRVTDFGNDVNPEYNLAIDVIGIYPPDDYEPNHSFDLAYDLGTLGAFSDTGLTIHEPGNDDYFRFTAGTSGEVEASIFFSHDLGDLDLYLYDGDRAALDVSWTVTDDETVSADVTAGDTYYVRVHGWSGATNVYDLEIDVSGVVPADDYEPNASFDSAYDLGTLGHFFDAGLTIHEPGNDDYFRFTAAAEGDLEASIFFNRDLGDLDLHLYNADREVISGSSSVTGGETLAAPVSTGESYYLRVAGEAGVTNLYDLDIAAPIAPDVYEPNHSFAWAYDLGTLGSWSDIGLTLHEPGNDDYFRFTAEMDGQVVVTLNSEHRIGNTDIHIYNNSQGELEHNWSFTSTVVARADVEQGEDYYVRVTDFVNEVNPHYDLAITVTEPAPPGVDVLNILVDFPDLQGDPLSRAVAESTFLEAGEFMRDASWGDFWFEDVDVTPTLRMPETTDYYTSQGAVDGALVLAEDAIAAALSAGFDIDDYWSYSVTFDWIAEFGWAGLGWVGAPGIWLNGYGHDPGVAAHEFGHNLGAYHSGWWNVSDGDPLSPDGWFVEYGDVFDVMGNSGAYFPNNPFNTYWTTQFGWMDAQSNVLSPTQDGIYRLYAHDYGADSYVDDRTYALQLPSEHGADYWLEFRQGIYSDPADAGLQLRLGPSSFSGEHTALIDASGEASFASDAPLMVGETYFDSASDLTITPVASGVGADGNWYIDVQVGDEVEPPDAPAIAAVLLSGSAWEDGFLDHLEAEYGHGGYPIPDGEDQLLALPWTNLDQVHLVFTDPVELEADGLSLFGVNAPEYSLDYTGFDDDSLTASWQLADPIDADRLLLHFDAQSAWTFDELTFEPLAYLDGDWSDGQSTFPSGDGQTSGDFAFRLNVLPGDVTQTGIVTEEDTDQVRDRQFTAHGDAAHSIFHDVDGSGSIMGGDVIQVRNREGSTLPEGEPLLPTEPLLADSGTTSVQANGPAPTAWPATGPTPASAFDGAAAAGDHRWHAAAWALWEQQRPRSLLDDAGPMPTANARLEVEMVDVLEAAARDRQWSIVGDA